jgi:hypothetical protein
MDEKELSKFIAEKTIAVIKEWTPKIEGFLNQDNNLKTKHEMCVKLLLIKVYAEKSLKNITDNVEIEDFNLLIEKLIVASTEIVTIIK